AVAVRRSRRIATITASAGKRGVQHERQNLCRYWRLDLRAVARRLLPERVDAKTRARICQSPSDLDRDQRHLLLGVQARKLGEWRDETPAGFVFAVKASRYCTN